MNEWDSNMHFGGSGNAFRETQFSSPSCGHSLVVDFSCVEQAYHQKINNTTAIQAVQSSLLGIEKETDERLASQLASNQLAGLKAVTWTFQKKAKTSMYIIFSPVSTSSSLYSIFMSFFRVEFQWIGTRLSFIGLNSISALVTPAT